MTQTAPNGEENKQPDGNNYYRHFKNSKEYADAYVDDFIRHYPEISGAKNEREFASVLKNYGYFGDSVENYAAGMEGITAPSSRTSRENTAYLGEGGKGEGNTWQRQHDGVSFEGAQPQLLDAVDVLGKWFYDRTGKRLVVTAATNGSHADGEHSHAAGWKVDVNDWDGESDGYLVTADGSRGTLTDEFIKFGQSIGLGMNWEGDHIDVALDGTQWDGSTESQNFGGFNPRKGQSQAGKSNERTKSFPSWQEYLKQQRESKTEEEPAKPLFDMNAQDSTTQKLLEQFASEQIIKADNSKNTETVNFFAGMFDEAGNFQNTQENRDALNNRFGERLTSWAENILSAEQKNSGKSEPKQAPKSETPPAKTDNPFQRNAAIRNAGKDFLEQLRTEGDKNKGEVAFRLQSALNKNNAAEIENILKQNNVPIPEQTQQQTQQQDPVTQNQPPENVLPKTKSNQPSKKLIAAANTSPKRGNKLKPIAARKNIGNALVRLANTLGVEIPSVDQNALLEGGSSKKIAEWQDKLKQAMTDAEQSQKQKASTEPPQSPLKNRVARIIQAYNQNARHQELQRRWDENQSKIKATHPSLKNFERRVAAHEETEKAQKKISLKESGLPDWRRRELPLWRGQTLADRAASRRQARNDLETSKLARMSERMSQLEANEAGAVRGENVPSDSLVDDIVERTRQAEKERRDDDAKRQANAESRRKMAEKVAQDDSGAAQVGQKIFQGIDADPDSSFTIPKELIQSAKKNRNDMAKKESPTQPPPKITEPPQETPHEQNAGVYGDETEVETATEAEHPVRYKVVEADTLDVSHRIEGGQVVPNENYRGIQPRDRERADIQLKMLKMAKKFNPKKALDTARSVNNGAVVTTGDGTVLNGNGRAGALIEVYKTGRGNEYKDALIKNAKRFGLNADEISKMNQPVLVREFAKDLTDAEKIDIADTTAGGSGMSASEQAKSDAKKLTANIFANIPQDAVIDFKAPRLSEATKDLLTNVLRAVENSDDISSYTQDDGSIGKLGIDRAEKAIIAYAYPSETIIKRMTDSTDDEIKLISNALLAASPDIFRARTGMEHGTLHKYDLGAITDAVDKFAALKAQGKKKSDYLKETTLDGTGLSAEAKEIVSFLYDNNRSGEKISKFLKGIAQGIQEQGDPNQGSLFGPSEPESFMSLIKKARQAVEKNESPKFSKSGEVDTRIEKFVEDKDLTPQQKLLKSFGEKLGTRTRFFDSADKRFHGVRKEGTTFLNVNSEKPLEKVFWHETMHWLSNNNPKIFKDLMKTTGITDEEILADQMEDIAKRTGLLQNVAGKNRGLIERVVQWLKDTMNKFIEHFRNPQGKLTTKQSIALADEFGKIAKDLKDADGKKIFRYNRQTHNIELADGSKLSSIETEPYALPQYSFAGRKANTANIGRLKQAEDMERRGSNRDEIFKATGWVKGKDNKWRFEIPDYARAINLRKPAENVGKSFRLDEIYDNHDLYAAYPQLRKLTVTAKEGMTARGQAVLKTGEIHLNKNLIRTDEARAKKTLVHEIQHFIQRIEDFAQGGAAKNAETYRRLGGEQEAREVAERLYSRNKGTPVIHTDDALITFGGKKIEAADSSSESLKQTIKSKMSNWFGKPNSRREKTITENLRKLSKHRILYGNVKGADDVVVDHLQKLIQSRHAYDWEKLLPVVGKEIAKNLKLNPTAEQSNYIADWLLTGALNNTSAEAKAFAKAMRDNPAMAELLMETREIFKEIANMSAEERIRNSIKPLQGKTFLEKIGAVTENFTEQMLDDLSPLQKVVDEAVKNGTPAIAEMLKRSVNPKQLAQLSRGSGDIAKLMVNGTEKELEKIRATLSEKYPGVYFDKFKPMTAIIQSVGGDWEGLQTFAVAKLSKEMYEYNRAHPELSEPLIPYTSEADADIAIKNGEKKFGEAQQDLVRYSKILLAMEHDAGLITDKTFYNLLKAWKNYVPMAQVFDENEDYVKLDYLKRRKGHLGNTWSPIEIMMANTHKRIQACERNKVKLEIATLVRFGDFDSNLSEVASGNPDADNIIRFKENGKIKYLETPDPAIKRAVDALQTQSDGDWITKILRAITSFMRSSYTNGNLDFAAGNIFRDMPDAYIHNNQLGKDVWVIGDFVKAWGSSVKELFNAARGKGMSRDYIDWKMNGGGQAAFVSQDVDYIQRSIDDATTTWTQRHKILNPVKFFSQLLDDMQKIAEFTENVTRLTTYKLAKEKLDNDGADSLTSKQLSALAAREATIDFAKAGHSVRKLNKHFFFANAAVQSLNQWIEAGKEFRKGNRKPLLGKLFRAAAHGVLVAGLQAVVTYLGGDDDRKKAYLSAQNWEKETYWILGDYKIPKGFDPVMRLFANLTDEFAGAVWADKPLEAERFWETFKGALPSLTATIATPAIEAYSNYSFFRKAPIVPQREQHLDAESQFDANTSWLAKKLSKNTVPLAKFFGAQTGLSPRQIDHLISGYLGSMVSSILKPNTTDPDKFPMIRRFVFEPYKNPKIVQEYYEACEEQTKHYNTYKLTKEKPDDYDPALYKRLKAVNETMRKISNRERAIINDPKLSYPERRAKLLELEKKRVALCEKVFRR